MSNKTSPPTKDDVLAILKAHRDLGPEFDSHLADQILDLWPDKDSRGKAAALRPQKAYVEKKRSHTGRIMLIMGISIPFLAIAGAEVGRFGVLAVLGFDAFIIFLTMVFG